MALWHLARFRAPRRFGDAMRNVIDGIEPRHVLLLQEIDRVAFPLREHRDEDVCAGDLLATGRLHMNSRALQHALKAGGRFCVVAMSGYEIGKLVVDKFRTSRRRRSRSTP